MSLDAIVNIMKGCVWPDHAASMHAGVAASLRKAGYQVCMEYPTGALGDTRDGRIDLVAIWDGGKAAIELDCRKPRKRSIHKLRLFDGYRVIGVRGIEGQPIPDGIDAVVTMRVRVPEDAEASDRRTINRALQ